MVSPCRVPCTWMIRTDSVEDGMCRVAYVPSVLCGDDYGISDPCGTDAAMCVSEIGDTEETSRTNGSSILVHEQ